MRLLEHGFALGVLTYQKEYAEKLTANAGDPDYKFISALVQSTSEVELLCDLPPNVFSPHPKVWSAVVRIKPRFTPTEEYKRFLQNLFNYRNKKIGKIVKNKRIPEELQDKSPHKIKPEEILELYKNTRQPKRVY